MSYGVWSLVIFLTFAVGMLGIWVLLDRGQRELTRVQQLAALDQAVADQGYGPFPVDTGPLLLLSDKAAALVAHEREVRAMITQAAVMAGIDTTLRQWCPTCQKATISKLCRQCYGQPLVCPVCHDCADEDDW